MLPPDHPALQSAVCLVVDVFCAACERAVKLVRLRTLLPSMSSLRTRVGLVEHERHAIQLALTHAYQSAEHRIASYSRLRAASEKDYCNE